MFPNIVDPSKRKLGSVTRHKKSKFEPPTTTGLALESPLKFVLDLVTSLKFVVDFVTSFKFVVNFVTPFVCSLMTVGSDGEKELEKVEWQLIMTSRKLVQFECSKKLSE